MKTQTLAALAAFFLTAAASPIPGSLNFEEDVKAAVEVKRSPVFIPIAKREALNSPSYDGEGSPGFDKREAISSPSAGEGSPGFERVKRDAITILSRDPSPNTPWDEEDDIEAREIGGSLSSRSAIPSPLNDVEEDLEDREVHGTIYSRSASPSPLYDEEDDLEDREVHDTIYSRSASPSPYIDEEEGEVRGQVHSRSASPAYVEEDDLEKREVRRTIFPRAGPKISFDEGIFERSEERGSLSPRASGPSPFEVDEDIEERDIVSKRTTSVFSGDNFEANVDSPITARQATSTSPTWTILAGQTLSSIADALKVPLSALEAANKQIANFDYILPGWVINVPFVAPGPAQYTVKAGDTLTSIAQAYAISLADLLKLNGQITTPDNIDVGWVINVPVIVTTHGGPSTS